MNTDSFHLVSDSVTPESLSSKHSPGPWVVGKSRARGQEVLIDSHAYCDRLMYSSWEGLAVAYGCDESPTVGAEIARANARLIAAAPELLEAVRRLMPRPLTGNPSHSELVEFWTHEHECGRGDAADALFALAALAKATSI